MKDIGMDPEFSCIFVHYILVEKLVALFKMLQIILVIFPPAGKICDLLPPFLEP